MKSQAILIIFILLSVLQIKVMIFQEKHEYWDWGAWFESPNIIIINGYNNEEELNRKMVHEYTHFLCQELFENYDPEHERCFV